MVGPLLLTLLLGGAGELPSAPRVEAQQAIERARYAFVIGNSKPFGELYPRSVFEARVARQIAEERVLERAFGMPATPALLAQEFERVEKTTRAPEQWEAIKKALGNERRRIEQGFCRPLLVERTLRSHFAFDQRVHAEPHRQARQARDAFLAKEKVPGTAVRLLRRRAEAAPTTDQLLAKAKAGAVGPRVLRPPVEADVGAPFPIDPEMAAVVEKELRRPGDVTTVLEQRDWVRGVPRRCAGGRSLEGGDEAVSPPRPRQLNLGVQPFALPPDPFRHCLLRCSCSPTLSRRRNRGASCSTTTGCSKNCSALSSSTSSLSSRLR